MPKVRGRPESKSKFIASATPRLGPGVCQALGVPRRVRTRESGSSGRTRTYNPSVNSRTAHSRLALQILDLHARNADYRVNWGDSNKPTSECPFFSNLLGRRLSREWRRRWPRLHGQIGQPCRSSPDLVFAPTGLIRDVKVHTKQGVEKTGLLSLKVRVAGRSVTGRG